MKLLHQLKNRDKLSLSKHEQRASVQQQPRVSSFQGVTVFPSFFSSFPASDTEACAASYLRNDADTLAEKVSCLFRYLPPSPDIVCLPARSSFKSK